MSSAKSVVFYIVVTRLSATNVVVYIGFARFSAKSVEKPMALLACPQVVRENCWKKTNVFH